jgi:hypothetical protein
MSEIPHCPTCQKNDCVTSDGGLKETLGTIGGAGAGLWAGSTLAGAAVTGAATATGLALAVLAAPVLLVGGAIAGGYLVRKASQTLDASGNKLRYFL